MRAARSLSERQPGRGSRTCSSSLFLFSSRRRHTRSYGDWSSDVCSSDLAAQAARRQVRRGDRGRSGQDDRQDGPRRPPRRGRRGRRRPGDLGHRAGVGGARHRARGRARGGGDNRLGAGRPGSDAVASTVAKILVADPLAEDGLERLRRAGEVTVVSKLGESELIRRIPEFDALVVRSETRVTAPIIEAGSKLRVVGRAGVGVDNIDVPAATRRGILVVNAPRGNIIAAAEHTIALLFALARWVPQADASVKRGEWTRQMFLGTEVRGKTLGVIGLGNVGSEVAKRAHGLEMDVVAYDPVVSVEGAELFHGARVGLHDLLEQADFVTVHVPLVDSNRNLIGPAELARMKPTARLINTARGGIVDEKALLEALRSGRLAAAAADVFETEPPGENPLLALPNFIATPHIARSE